ncbi:ATP-binding protein [Rhodococcus oxybenzonivorans]|uniref:sensor histidine kinase n=1 Tax=Rhodococcus oxybenzonivorans TaxID=1990687 RepID=UPI00295459DA|nr:ATP-binding protein [Rhodococcus oxybenzonivorans]MDV7353704.1 ATP-binding protein [Rhodococcus oxybenzonivorans]
MAGEQIRTPRRWWKISGWPLLWKIIVVLAVPLLVAVSLGGLRVQTALRASIAFSEMAASVQLLPQLVALDNAVAIVTGTLAQRTVTEDMIDELDDMIVTVDTTRRSALLDHHTAAALDEALAASRSVSGQAKTGVSTVATSVLTAQRDAVRNTLSTVVAGIVDPITDQDVAVQANQVADMWAAQRTLSEQGLSVVELTAVQRGESTTPPQAEIWSFLATLRTESALIDVPARRYRTDDPNIAAIRTQIDARTRLLRGSLDQIPGQTVLDELKQSLFSSVAAYTGAVTTSSAELRKAVEDKSGALRTAAWRDTSVVAGLLFGGVVVAVMVAVSLLIPLRRLRTGARQIARHDLPTAIERIKVGDDRNAVATRRIDVHTEEELGQLARAVDDIHEQALRLAGEQAHLRLQMHSMFETLARRNKSLVDLQLELIEKLELDERDPSRLEHLFRLDHLAARLRRNGENLLILAGDHDRRTRLAPIRFGDIARAAISEVEFYQRVHVTPAPAGALTGAVAVDLVHMLAELIDNALCASPPESTVTIGFARTIEGGTVISVVDYGIGISRDDLAAINTRLATRTEATADTTRHMGLFVVGQLAARHRMTVQLTATTPVTRNGGITATVTVPGQSLVTPVQTDRPEQQCPPLTPASTVALAPTRGSQQPASPGPSEPGAAVSAKPSNDPDTNTDPRPRHLLTTAYTAPTTAVTSDDDVSSPIFFGMVSDEMSDPAAHRIRPEPGWGSAADAGWSAARHAARSPVETVTDVGLPQRIPGDRLVPGGLVDTDTARRRDPEAIRDNLGRHLSGVRDGRATSRPLP